MMSTLKWIILIAIFASLLFSAFLVSGCEKESSSNSSYLEDDDDLDDDDTGDDDFDDDDFDDDEDDDCGDDDDSGGGVWVDESSGLMWQKTSKCCCDLLDAYYYCQDLKLEDYNNWRLPSISEFRTLIRGCPATETGGECGVTDDCAYYGYDDDDDDYGHESCWDSSCRDCTKNEGPADGCYWPSQLNGECDIYWSGTHVWDDYSDSLTWGILFYYGAVADLNNSLKKNVRCVRDAD